MQAEITAINALYPGIKAIFMKPDPDFTYKPGQYIQIAFGGFSPRSYSVAGVPSPDGELEIHIKDFGPGGASHYATHDLAPGDMVAIDGPFGNCTYDVPEQGRPLLVIAGGLGITPLKAIIDDVLRRPDPVPVTLYWGARSVEELYLKSYFEDLAHRHDGFKFIPVTGGAIGPVAVAQYPDLAAASIFLAGPPAMISSTITLLRDKDVAARHIHYDTHPEAVDGAGADDKTGAGAL